jgi:hypothetical protein
LHSLCSSNASGSAGLLNSHKGREKPRNNRTSAAGGHPAPHRGRYAGRSCRISELQTQVAEKHQITVEVMIERLERAAANATADKQHGAVVSALTAQAKLAGLWVDRAENINGNYAISDKPLTEQEWVEKHVKH